VASPLGPAPAPAPEAVDGIREDTEAGAALGPGLGPGKRGEEGALADVQDRLTFATEELLGVALRMVLLLGLAVLCLVVSPLPARSTGASVVLNCLVSVAEMCLNVANLCCLRYICADVRGYMRL
jgi:hypothetical protein